MAFEQKIKLSVEQANKLYFFGFSFNQENCEVLGLLRSETPSIFSTGVKDIFYTNFRDSKKITKKFYHIFDGKTAAVSNKGVYDALSEDFDLSLT